MINLLVNGPAGCAIKDFTLSGMKPRARAFLCKTGTRPNIFNLLNININNIKIMRKHCKNDVIF
jgi:hypothetical protein